MKVVKSKQLTEVLLQGSNPVNEYLEYGPVCTLQNTTAKKIVKKYVWARV